MGTAMHRILAEKAKSCLEKDSRFLGMAIGGSWIDSSMDEYSDLDFYLILEKGQQFSLTEKKEILDNWGNQLSCYINGHDENVSISLFSFAPQLLHVDCKWIPIEGFRNRVENPVIIFEKNNLLTDCISKYPSEGYQLPNLELNEQRFWTWMHYVLSKIARGEILEAFDYLCEVRSCCIGPMVLHKNGLPGRRMRYAEKVCAEDLKLIYDSIPLKCDAIHCFRATMGMIELYRKTRDALKTADFKVNAASEAACLEYAAYIKNKINNGIEKTE